VREHFKEVGTAGVLVILPEMVYEEIFDQIENLAVAVHARLDVFGHDLLREYYEATSQRIVIEMEAAATFSLVAMKVAVHTRNGITT
jgi:hypothetical protein